MTLVRARHIIRTWHESPKLGPGFQGNGKKIALYLSSLLLFLAGISYFPRAYFIINYDGKGQDMI